MTRPTPQHRNDDEDELRIRWLLRYLRVQTKFDTRVKTILIASAQEAFDRVDDLASNSTFSAKVRSAQIRMVMKELSHILQELFGEILPVIRDGQRASAQEAVEAFAEQDDDYLRKAFRETSVRSGIDLDRFIAGQKKSASLHVVSAIRNVEQRKDYDLSTQVYRTRRLADTWVRRQVTSGILRGDGAKEIAKSVRSSIRPATPGGVSYAAMRLGRTEINNSFHATSVALSQDRPWVEGMVWHLSKVHEYDDQRVPEICETYAGQVFEVNHVPAKPHPQCRCFVTPQLEPFDVFARSLTAGRYRDWMDNAA